MIHWLGGSAQSWREVSEQLAPSGLRCVAVDLPGFGRNADSTELSISEMARALVQTIRSLRSSGGDAPWFLAGHSMGGKLAAITARAAEDGAEGLQNLRGMVLLSPSPPGPEPMKESKRTQTLQSLGKRTLDAKENHAHAAKFVDDNTGKLPLLPAIRERSVEDVLRMDPDALRAWLTVGSKEDWSKDVGVLSTPTLVSAGTEEEALGPDAQKTCTLPHLSHGTLVALDGCGHLAPLERPFEVADRVMEFFQSLGLRNAAEAALPGDRFQALIASDRTSPQTRKVLQDRIHHRTDNSPANPDVLLPEELRTLRALAARVIPGSGFDLAVRLNHVLAQSRHDGWRFESLPGDAAAWKQGLFSLNAAAAREFGVPFAALDPARRDDLLKRAQHGRLGEGVLAALHLGHGAGAFSASQMRDWFEDVRSELVKLYVSDPRTMERIGFTGLADEQGFTQIKLSEREAFEI
jgi:pimeloyl-ACP methyl ester carboxylesterase